MTSLPLFDSDRLRNEIPSAPTKEWGTGKLNKNINRPRSPRPSGTFLCSGDPITQNYENTMITLSNVRLNDELVPAPLHTTNIHEHQIPLEFPSNHPYTSHISEKAVFPTASTDSEDHPSTYSDPYIVTHKCRSNPFRREVHYHGLQRDRHRVFKWPDKHYMQLPRSFSDVSSSSSIYPWPRKMLAPNNKSPSVEERTTTMKNKERSLLETTYHNDYCDSEGLGTHVVFDSTKSLSPTEQLKPHFQKTFNPSRSFRTADIPTTKSPAMSNLQRSKTTLCQSSMATTRLMSKDESLDWQLQNGTDYVNLPEHLFPTEQAPLYTIETVSPGIQVEENQREIRYLHPMRPATAANEQILRDHRASHQQMDAENRLHQLSLIRPKENITILNQKFLRLQNPRHARPILAPYRDDYVNTLYDQMGNYVQERSGLYHTHTYNPTALAQSIPELEYAKKLGSAKGLTATDQGSYLDNLLKRAEQIQQRTKPASMHEKPIGDYELMRDQLIDKMRVPQDASTVDPRVQEGPHAFVQRETTYGQIYNTRKFLQENVLLPDARIDPTNLMSTNYNYNLERVRVSNSTQIQPQQNESQEDQTDTALVSPSLYPPHTNNLYSTNQINEQNDGHLRRSTARVYDSPFRGTHDLQMFQIQTQPGDNSSDKVGQRMVASALPRAAKITMGLPAPELVSRQVEPISEPHTTYQHSYKNLSFHELPKKVQQSPRISKTRSASLRTGTQHMSLLDLQDHWSKTQAQSNYHHDYPEPVPYVGDSTLRGKKAILVADTWAKQNMRVVK